MPRTVTMYDLSIDVGASMNNNTSTKNMKKNIIISIAMIILKENT